MSSSELVLDGELEFVVRSSELVVGGELELGLFPLSVVFTAVFVDVVDSDLWAMSFQRRGVVVMNAQKEREATSTINQPKRVTNISNSQGQIRQPVGLLLPLASTDIQHYSATQHYSLTCQHAKSGPL